MNLTYPFSKVGTVALYECSILTPNLIFLRLSASNASPV